MTENKMYSQRAKQGNIAVMRFCDFGCGYCAFQKFQKISSCQKCRDGVNHSHMEVLQRKPPRTKEGEFLTVGLSGDVSFMPVDDFWQVIEYCRKWKDRTFLIQSKNPAYFLRFQDMVMPLRIPDNLILGTTIESNKRDFTPLSYHTDLPHYDYISAAPYPDERYEAMLKLTCRKAVTTEPILNFDLDIMVRWIRDINPEICWIGYDNHNHKLPEPTLEKTLELIDALELAGIDVRRKTLRPAWWQE